MIFFIVIGNFFEDQYFYKMSFIISNLEWATKLKFYQFDKTNNEIFLFSSETFWRSISDSGNTIFLPHFGLQTDYRIDASTSPSCFETHIGLFILPMKGIFDPYVLWPFDKKLIF